MICIYHNRDLDGWTSAAIVRKKYPYVKLIGWDYGQPIPDIPPSKHVIMVDISFPETEMLKLIENNFFIWIDHHISAIKTMEGYEIDGLREDKFAACELTWKYLFDKPIPEAVRLLGMYDSFRHKGTEEERSVLLFQYAARSLASSPKDARFFLRLKQRNIEKLIQFGRYIYNYLETEAKQKYERKFIIDFDGHKFAVINDERFNPINFGINYHEDGYDGFACFWYKNNQWMFSLYNDNGKVDCSDICKRRGGGGHKGAAGFRVDDIKTILK